MKTSLLLYFQPISALRTGCHSEPIPVHTGRKVFPMKFWSPNSGHLSPGWASRELVHLLSCPCVGGQTQGLTHVGVLCRGCVGGGITLQLSSTPSPEFWIPSNPFKQEYGHVTVPWEEAGGRTGRKQVLKAVKFQAHQIWIPPASLSV